MYYLLEVKTYDTGKADSKKLTAYDKLKDAIANAHLEYGLNKGAATIKTVMCKVIDGRGTEQLNLFWKASALEAMNFYTIIVNTFNDGTADFTKLYTFDTDVEASSTAHTQYGKNMVLENISTTMATVVNSTGAAQEGDTLYWNEPVPTPEPETEEVTE